MDLVIEVCLFAYLLLIKTDHNQNRYLLKNQTKKTETAVFAIKTSQNQTGKFITAVAQNISKYFKLYNKIN